MTTAIPSTVTTGSVWDVLCDSPEESARMQFDSELLGSINAKLKRSKWSRDKAARKLGVTLSRLDDLREGRISRFTTENLMDLATRLSIRMYVNG